MEEYIIFNYIKQMKRFKMIRYQFRYFQNILLLRLIITDACQVCHYGYVSNKIVSDLQTRIEITEL
jgi:hypothetical protein